MEDLWPNKRRAKDYENGNGKSRRTTRRGEKRPPIVEDLITPEGRRRSSRMNHTTSLIFNQNPSDGSHNRRVESFGAPSGGRRDSTSQWTNYSQTSLARRAQSLCEPHVGARGAQSVRRGASDHQTRSTGGRREESRAAGAGPRTAQRSDQEANLRTNCQPAKRCGDPHTITYQSS